MTTTTLSLYLVVLRPIIYCTLDDSPPPSLFHKHQHYRIDFFPDDEAQNFLLSISRLAGWLAGRTSAAAEPPSPTNQPPTPDQTQSRLLSDYSRLSKYKINPQRATAKYTRFFTFVLLNNFLKIHPFDYSRLSTSMVPSMVISQAQAQVGLSFLFVARRMKEK
jgi:hypothetical protein